MGKCRFNNFNPREQLSLWHQLQGERVPWLLRLPGGEEDDALWALHWCSMCRGCLLPCFTSTIFQISCCPGDKVSQSLQYGLWATTPKKKCVAGARKFFQDSADLLP